MPWCGSRRFRHSRPSRKQPKTSIFRNPCVVLLISFVMLAFINLFHVPARSKKAATRIIQRASASKNHHHHKPNRHQLLQNSTTTTMTMSIHYVLVEEGVENHRKFKKYQAMSSKNESLSFIQWAKAVVAAEKDESASIHIIDALNTVIANAPYGALFFETRPFVPSIISTTRADHTEDVIVSPMEFVLVDAPDLDRLATNHPDIHTFADAIASSQLCNDHAAVFENLGKDATLIAPKITHAPNTRTKTKQIMHHAPYAHLASFVRSSHVPIEQKRALWRLATQAILQLLSSSQQQTPPNASTKSKNNHPDKIWFSTSGLGVYWLHLRLDRYPKYYTYTPYKER